MATEKPSQSAPAQDAAPKKPKQRSPNYPVVGLAKAVELATKIQETYGAFELPLNLAHRLWKYKEWSSVGDQCVAALKAYGLIKVTGQGKARKLALSDAGSRIARNAPDRESLIRAAATAPSIHREIIAHFGSKGLPNDTLLRQYLVWERQEGQRFNADTVDTFIERFRNTLSFSGATVSDITGETPQGNEDDSEVEISIGDYVQWTLDGVDRFKVPQKVVAIDGDWAFVETSPTGISMAELTLQEPQVSQSGASRPPSNPHFKRQPETQWTTDGVAIERKTLDEGDVELTLPRKLGSDSVDDFEYWVKGLIRRLRRNAGMKPSDPKPHDASEEIDNL